MASSSSSSSSSSSVTTKTSFDVFLSFRGYASSPWCLDELMKILECRKTMQRMVLPVFYHVDPSDVEEPSGDFGDAFQKLEEKYKTSMPNWRFALKEATTLSGWDSKNHRY
ncbi:transmembrane receptor, putative [Ricinus communis]|uniref:Transmembrane receptor, putative n=1 Tax=Ricinus communis TaxID=3988 RepID=B9SBU0_RICCO|nr:transmembrane receptor, putative [Ricinus communis]